ncbi:MAG TPA: hypothetical protein VFE53_20670 [Mucilaginibacter sp.]|nr:hypothetical protein [Mucilaginibacter sp.]
MPNKTNNNNSITANIDGANVTFNVNASARVIPGGVPGYLYVIEITGATDTSSSKATIEINFGSVNPITSGTFLSASNQPPPATFLAIVYDQYTPGAQFPAGYITNPNVPSSSTITISSISNTSVQGTFSGALVYETNYAGTGKNVTNGKFSLTLN